MVPALHVIFTYLHTLFFNLVSPDDLRALRDELALLRGRNRELQDNLAERDALLTDLTQSNNTLQDELQVYMRRLDTAAVELDDVRGRLKVSKLDVDQLRQNLESLLRDTEQKDCDIVALGDRCAKFDLLQTQLHAAQDERDLFARQLRESSSQIEQLVRQLNASDSNRELLEAEVSEARAICEDRVAEHSGGVHCF